MAELKHIMCFSSDEASLILVRFIKRYVDSEKLKKYFLLWNALRKDLGVKCFPREKIKLLSFHLDKSILFYDERKKILYSTTMKDVIDFLQNLTPWEEVDACLFDHDMDWGVAITHEDKMLCWGNVDMI